MTIAEMVQELSDQARDAKLVGLNATQAYRWLNMFQNTISGKYSLPFLRKQVTFDTVASQQTYTLSQMGATDCRYPINFWIPAIPRKLWPIDEGKLAEWYPHWNIYSGPIYRYIWRNTSVDFWRVPDGVWHIYFSYQRTLVQVAAGVDCELPDWSHPFIVKGALVSALRYSGNPQYDFENMDLKMMERDFSKSIYRRPDARHVLGTQESSHRLPFPVLPPDHFPSY